MVLYHEPIVWSRSLKIPIYLFKSNSVGGGGEGGVKSPLYNCSHLTKLVLLPRPLPPPPPPSFPIFSVFSSLSFSLNHSVYYLLTFPISFSLSSTLITLIFALYFVLCYFLSFIPPILSCPIRSFFLFLLPLPHFITLLFLWLFPLRHMTYPSTFSFGLPFFLCFS